MKNKYQASRLIPRLHQLRAVRIYFFPWVLAVSTIILAAMSLHIGTDLLITSLLLAFLVTAFVLKDLTSAQSLITRFYYQLVSLTPWYDYMESVDFENENVLYNRYDYPPLFPVRGIARFVLYFLILIALSGYAIFQSRNPTDVPVMDRALTTYLIIVLMLLIYSRFVSMPVAIARSYRIVVWTVFTIWIGATYSICTISLQVDLRYVIGSSAAFFCMLLSLFVAQRLWADSHIRKDVIYGLTHSLLTWPRIEENLNGAAARIGVDLRIDRVFILLPDDEFSHLRIKDQFGVQRSIYNHPIPFEKSICGRAWQQRTSVLWNNVAACPYFYALSDDNTAAEAAIPITHDGDIYGILDVQFVKPDILGPSDLESLETVAQALGTALAASRSKVFFDDALTLWQQINEAASTPLATEEEVFELFADFAHDRLSADLVIYFPLSLADCPTQSPFVSGKFLHPDPILPPNSDPDSSLVCLVKKWEPYFEETVTEDSIVARPSSDDEPSFITREKIRSTCFIPIGLQSERLGALFLNYRKPRQFDKIFRFTCLSLAQSLAKATAQVRYRDMIYSSFGRPEINLHNVLGRHGLKGGVMQRAISNWQSCPPTNSHEIEACPLYTICYDTDNFISEISLTESSIPPNFWQETLETRLRSYISSLPDQQSGRRPQISLKKDAQVERENPWFKLALYRIITEAVNNAILHGKATNIVIDIKRDNTHLQLRVKNNGLPLPEDALRNASSNGIFYLLDQFKDKFGADVAAISKKEDGKGSIVTVSCPVLPPITLHC